jgi:Uncharacterised nucleotidyltransferase
VGTFWPSRRERLLLLTALAEPDQALRAWQELRRDFDLQTAEDLAFAALPLVFQRLHAAGVDDPDLARLKGIYRSTWAKNTLLVERLRTTAEAFRAAGVPMLVVGGIGAALRYYEMLGLRPTGELDLLVREVDTTQAVRALGNAGWSTHGATRRGRAAPLPLFDEAGTLCLLRTSLAPDFVTETGEPGETPLWEAAVEVDVNRTPVRMLPPTDDLLATIVTGARANPIRSVQWIVDAAMILRSSEEIDSERLCRIGIERGQGLRLGNALEYLQRLLGSAPLPAVQESLGRWKPSARERFTYACTSRSMPVLGSFPQALGEHLGATAGRSAWATVAALPAFLRARWELDHAWQLPVAGGRRALRQLGRRRVGPADPR